jgi:hypothetical protein
MSKFIEQLNDYSNLKLIPRSITLNYRKKYEDSKDEMKAIYDRNADVLLKSEIESRELNNLRSIKKNMQFLAWVMIINLLGILYFVLTFN